MRELGKEVGAAIVVVAVVGFFFWSWIELGVSLVRSLSGLTFAEAAIITLLVMIMVEQGKTRPR